MDIFEKLTNIEKYADQFGFRWDNSNQILRQIRSECSEIEDHLYDKNARNKLHEEIGDLLHAVFSLCIFEGFQPQETLKMSLDKFEKRFNAVKDLTAAQGLSDLNGKSFDELMKVWEEAKKKVG